LFPLLEFGNPGGVWGEIREAIHAESSPPIGEPPPLLFPVESSFFPFQLGGHSILRCPRVRHQTFFGPCLSGFSGPPPLPGALQFLGGSGVYPKGNPAAHGMLPQQRDVLALRGLPRPRPPSQHKEITKILPWGPVFSASLNLS